MRRSAVLVHFVLFFCPLAFATDVCEQLLSPRKVTVYRALVLESEGSAIEIMARGLDSPFLLNTAALAPEERSRALSNLLASGALKLIYQRYKRLTPGSLDMNPFMSVSSYPDVAIAVANSYRRGAEGNVYLFRIELPPGDLIRLGKDYPNPFALRVATALGLNTIIEFPNGKQNVYAFDENVESFVYLNILARQIKAVFRVPNEEAPVFNAGLLKRGKIEVDKETLLQGLRPIVLDQ